MSNDTLNQTAKPWHTDIPDIFARTRDGGFVTMHGPDARKLADCIRAVVDEEAAIIPADLVQPAHWLWRCEE